MLLNAFIIYIGLSVVIQNDFTQFSNPLILNLSKVSFFCRRLKNCKYHLRRRIDEVILKKIINEVSNLNIFIIQYIPVIIYNLRTYCILPRLFR